jgi:transcriptional regulator with XRE-family HTH domain
MLREARRRARLSQRVLARRAGVPQPTVAKIETGVIVPRVDTLDRLLEPIGQTLEVTPRPGAGLDRTGYRELLRLTPRQRLERAADEARALARLTAKARA